MESTQKWTLSYPYRSELKKLVNGNGECLWHAGIRGIKREPYFIERIERLQNDEWVSIYEHSEDDRYLPQRILTESVSCWATDALWANVAKAPESVQVANGLSTCGRKTGTTETLKTRGS